MTSGQAEVKASDQQQAVARGRLQRMKCMAVADATGRLPRRRADHGCSAPQPLCYFCGLPGARRGLQQQQDLAQGHEKPAAAAATRYESIAASAHLTMSGGCSAECDIKHIATTCSGSPCRQQHRGRLTCQHAHDNELDEVASGECLKPARFHCPVQQGLVLAGPGSSPAVLVQGSSCGPWSSRGQRMTLWGIACSSSETGTFVECLPVGSRQCTHLSAYAANIKVHGSRQQGTQEGGQHQRDG